MVWRDYLVAALLLYERHGGNEYKAQIPGGRILVLALCELLTLAVHAFTIA